MTDDERIDFGTFLHRCKQSGDYGSGERGDFTRAELIEKAGDYLEEARRGDP